MAYRRKLISPAGNEYEAKSPTEANDLVFGAGYVDAAQSEPEAASEPVEQRPASRASTRGFRAEHKSEKESAAE